MSILNGLIQVSLDVGVHFDRHRRLAQDVLPGHREMLSIVPSQGDLQEFFIRSKKLLEND
jgi:hypothetical protein